MVIRIKDIKKGLQNKSPFFIVAKWLTGGFLLLRY